MYYDWPIITDGKVTNNRSDIVVLNETDNEVYLIDVACPNNKKLLDKHMEKQEKYSCCI